MLIGRSPKGPEVKGLPPEKILPGTNLKILETNYWAWWFSAWQVVETQTPYLSEG